ALLARGHHERVHPPVAVVRAERLGQLGVKREARAGQRPQRRIVAPVERQEAAGLAGGSAGHGGALEYGDADAAPGQEVRDAGADDTGAADDHVPGWAHVSHRTQSVTLPGTRRTGRLTTR